MPDATDVAQTQTALMAALVLALALGLLGAAPPFAVVAAYFGSPSVLPRRTFSSWTLFGLNPKP